MFTMNLFTVCHDIKFHHFIEDSSVYSHCKIIKSRSPHPRDYPHRPTDYRHRDKHLRLVIQTDGQTLPSTLSHRFAVDKNLFRVSAIFVELYPFKLWNFILWQTVETCLHTDSMLNMLKMLTMVFHLATPISFADQINPSCTTKRGYIYSGSKMHKMMVWK